MIRRLQPVLASALLFSCVICLNGQQRREPIRRVFERFAGTVVVLGPGEFIYGFRESSRIPKRELALLKEFTNFLERERWKPSEFLPLLKHDDPKVRTLALVALYDLEDPSVLPHIFPLVTDEASTFVAVRRFASAMNVRDELTPELTEQQTVGSIAAAILNAYLETGGYSYGPLGMHEQPGFKEYWKLHGGRPTAAGWWKLRLARASHATTPTPRDRYAGIKRLRSRIDKLPQSDRAFTLLLLHGENGSDLLVTRQELVAILKQLGPDNLLDLLKRKIRSDDPDLQPENKNSPQGAMSVFILQHSSSLLRQSDAKALLDQEVTERNFQNNSIVEPTLSPWWAIGAAQLNPPEAESILKPAYERFQDEFDSPKQLELAHALWRLVGETQAQTVANWIYNQLAKPMGIESYMLDQILRTSERRNVVLAKAIIEDDRFEQLNWKSLEVLAKLMNSWSGQELVSAAEMEGAWSPLGTDFFMRDKSKALAQYPKEIGELLNALSRWREALRKSVRS
jgi:hypothetical protein